MAARKKAVRKTTPVDEGQKVDLMSLAEDPQKLKEGAWVKSPYGFRIKVKKPGPEYHETILKLGAPYRVQARTTGDIPEEVQQEIVARAEARHVMVDWEDIQLDGKDYPFSEENAYNVFMDPRLQWFYDWCRTVARQGDTYRYDNVQADAGN